MTMRYEAPRRLDYTQIVLGLIPGLSLKVQRYKQTQS